MYNFTIQRRSGEANHNADGLSRRPCERNDLRDCIQCQHKEGTRCRAVDISNVDDSEEDTVLKCCDADVATTSDNRVPSSGAVCAARAPESERSVDADVFTNDAMCEAQDADEPVVPVLRELLDGRVEGDATHAPCDQPAASGTASTEAGLTTSTSRQSRLPVPIARSKHGDGCEEAVELETNVPSGANHDVREANGRSSDIHRVEQPNRRLRPNRHIRRPARYRD